MGNTLEKKLVDEYKEVHKKLVDAFVEKYYTDEDGSVSEYRIMFDHLEYAPATVEINDEYWDISSMYEALLLDITEKSLQDWYRYNILGGRVNLVNWHNGCPRRTNSDLKETKSKLDDLNLEKSELEDKKKQIEKYLGG